MKRDPLMSTAVEEWLAALGVTEPRPQDWQADDYGPRWVDSVESWHARRQEDLRDPAPNVALRRAHLERWASVILTGQFEEQTGDEVLKLLAVSALTAESIAEAAEILSQAVAGLSFDEAKTSAGWPPIVITVGREDPDPPSIGSLVPLLDLLVAMDEFCRWATWRGYFCLDPFAASRPRRPAVKDYHGGVALDSSYFIDVGLSGGGHRATLYGLGALMAIHDSGRAPRCVSSVSGGSITNTYLAHHYWSNPEDHSEEHWQSATRGLLDTVVDHGLLTRFWLVLLYLLLCLPPIALLLAALSGWLPALVYVPLFGIWATAAMFRGILVEQLIRHRYFGNKNPTLWSLHGTVEHIVCCTDLVTGAPFYASSEAWMARGGRSGPVTYSGALTASVSRLVRASAGFPGIPPRRLSLRSFTYAGTANGDEHQVAFLSDGGLWNNLATQVFEDDLLQRDFVVVVADASAPISGVGHRRFQIPGVAEIAGLVRQVIVQNSNTVVPRRDFYRNGIRLETLFPGEARFKARRLCAVSACLDSPRDIVARFEAYLEDPFKDAVQFLWPERREGVVARLSQLAGSATLERLQSLAYPPGWTGDAINDPISAFPTTLGKVPRDIAVGIVGRGYANTAITLYLTRLADSAPTPTGWLADAAGIPQPSPS